MAEEPDHKSVVVCLPPVPALLRLSGVWKYFDCLLEHLCLINRFFFLPSLQSGRAPVAVTARAGEAELLCRECCSSGTRDCSQAVGHSQEHRIPGGFGLEGS